MTHSTKILPVLFIGLILTLCNLTRAQDTFNVTPFANANSIDVNKGPVPDATLRLDNPGTTYSTICAMIYVFTPDQRMAECCGCPTSPNGLRTISVNKDLTANPLTGVTLHNGVFMIVTGAVNGSPCDPTAQANLLPTHGCWHSYVPPCEPGKVYVNCGQSSPGWIFEENLCHMSRLGSAEYSNLQAQCAFIHVLGSGKGICTCGKEN